MNPPSGTEKNTTTNPAGGLSAAAYTDAGFFEREQKLLFARTWTCIGILDDVPNSGDARPVRIAGQDLLMVRDEEGNLQVLHNYCRHRGHPILTEPACGLKRLMCPYHAWAYDLDGALRRAPHFDGVGKHRSSKDADQLPGLKPVRTAFWHRLVFVNLSGYAEPFEQYIAPLEERWSAYDFSKIRHGKSLVYEVNCNWKLAIENFIDFYHLPAVHKGLNGYSAMQDHYFIRHDGSFFGEGNDEYAPNDAAVGNLPPFPDLTPELSRKTEALCVFPNLLITVFSDNLRIIIVDPLEPGRCRERIHVFFIGDGASAAATQEARDTAVSRFLEFNDEDIGIIEALQNAFSADAFDGGCLSPYFDQNIEHFQGLIRDAVSQDGR
jgi:choline monooxygenase